MPWQTGGIPQLLRECLVSEFLKGYALFSYQATATEPLEETDPAGLVLLHTLGSAQNLAVAVLIDRNGYQNGYILKLSAPVAAQYNGSQKTDHGFQNNREHGKLKTEKEMALSHEESTHRNSKQNWFWRCPVGSGNWGPLRQNTT